MAEPQAGRLKRGRCRVRRGQGIPHPGERSRDGRSQAGAGRKERPLECAGLHSSSLSSSLNLDKIGDTVVKGTLCQVRNELISPV